MTFPGESLAVFAFGNVSGLPILDVDAVTYRAQTSIFTSGDEAWVDVALSPWLLAPGDDAVVSWVFEVMGGSGTFDLTEDAGSLGSHTVTGAGTLVVASALTAADVLAGGTARLTLACTSGTVEVQQVKLRVWPPGGVVGGWSGPFQPAAVSSTLTLRVSPQAYVTPTFLTGTSIDAVMTATQAELRGDFDGTPIGDPLFTSTVTPVGAAFYALAEEFVGADPPARGSGNIGGGVSYLERGAPFVPDPPGDYGIDWVYPPNEVPDDPDKWDVVGADEWGWWQGVASIVISPDTAGPPIGVFRVTGDNVPGLDSPSLTFGEITDAGTLIAGLPAGEADYLGEFDLPPWGDDTDLMRLTFFHDGAKTQQGIARTTTDITGTTKTTGNAQAAVHLGRFVGEDFIPALPSYTAGAYRYWTLTAVAPLALQWSQRADGEAMSGVTAWSAGRASRNAAQWRAPL